MISLISSIEKGLSRHSKFGLYWISSEGFTVNLSNSVIPNLSLNSCQMMFSLSLWLVIVVPSGLLSSLISLCLYFIEAFAWKKWVPASPSCTHLTVPLCLQYILYFSWSRRSVPVKFCENSILVHSSLYVQSRFLEIGLWLWHWQWLSWGFARFFSILSDSFLSLSFFMWLIWHCWLCSAANPSSSLNFKMFWYLGCCNQ